MLPNCGMPEAVLQTPLAEQAKPVGHVPHPLDPSGPTVVSPPPSCGPTEASCPGVPLSLPIGGALPSVAAFLPVVASGPGLVPPSPSTVAGESLHANQDALITTPESPTKRRIFDIGRTPPNGS